MPSIVSRRGSRVPLARAQKLGIRTSNVSSWSRSHSFNFAVRATVILIAIIIAYAVISITIILSKIDFHQLPPQYNTGVQPMQDTVCSSRQQHKWRIDLDSQFRESPEEVPSFAVVLTVNDGFWDFFSNWLGFFDNRVANTLGLPILLIVIAEDAAIYKRLKALPQSKNYSTLILPGYNYTNDSTVDKAADYDSPAYKSLVSSRASHLLNLICSLGECLDNIENKTDAQEEMQIKKEKLTIVYTDVDTVWLKNPFPYIQTEMFGANSNDTQIHQQRQQPKYDMLAAIDDRNYLNYETNLQNIEKYYCTGILVIAQTPASIGFLSDWEKELQSKPQLNQPLFNTLVRSTKRPKIRHGGLGDTEFTPGRLYFDEWVKDGEESERLKKKESMVVHNNYIVGHHAKKKRFEEHGLWLNAVQK